MRATRRLLIPYLVAAGWVGTTSAVAQERKAAGPTVLEQPMGQLLANPLLRVTEVGAGGKVRLELRPDLERLKGVLSFTEGYYLLIVGSATDRSRVRLFRVEVSDVATDLVLTVAVGPGAAKQIREGDPATLIRPARSTTAVMKALPGVIPLGTKGAAGPGEGPKHDVAGVALKAKAQARSVNNLKQIGLAMHNWHSVNGQYPPAVIFGPDGKPWHSWRVLILPYIEQTELFNQYDFREPWDSEKNLKLLDRMPATYRDPAYGDEKEHFTHYAALVGPRTAFTPEGGKMTAGKPVEMNKGGLSNRMFTDGTANTILIAPVSPDRKIPWTKPEDITAGPKFPGLGQPGGIAAPYEAGHEEGATRIAPVLMADGSVHFLARTIAPQVLNALLTINGNEIIPPTAFYNAGPLPGTAPQTMLRIRIEGGKAEARIE